MTLNKKNKGYQVFQEKNRTGDKTFETENMKKEWNLWCHLMWITLKNAGYGIYKYNTTNTS